MRKLKKKINSPFYSRTSSTIIKKLYPHQKKLYPPRLRRGLGAKSPAGFGA
jgi:hypothetical protein